MQDTIFVVCDVLSRIVMVSAIRKGYQPVTMMLVVAFPDVADQHSRVRTVPLASTAPSPIACTVVLLVFGSALMLTTL